MIFCLSRLFKGLKIDSESDKTLYDKCLLVLEIIFGLVALGWIIGGNNFLRKIDGRSNIGWPRLFGLLKLILPLLKFHPIKYGFIYLDECCDIKIPNNTCLII